MTGGLLLGQKGIVVK